MNKPEGLSDSAGQWYVACARQYRLRTAGELQTLAEAARSLTRIEQCQQAIAKDGLFTAGDRGLVAHPALREERQHRTLFLQAVRQLGLSQPIVEEPTNGESTT